MTPTDPKNRQTPGPAGATPKSDGLLVCTACGTSNTAESKFCGGCAAPLKGAPVIEAEMETRTVRASAIELARGNRLAERYEIIEELGRGGMGKVFKVYDHKVSEVIALKLIRPEISVQDKAIERFKNELKYTRKIAHRNICRMYDLGEVDYVYYITMEYVAGEDLKRFVKRAGPLNAAKAVMIAGQICNGLAEAHRIGAVHRDLKPQNIMIDADGNAKIMDFGIARFTDMDRMTGSGVMIGTPEYMSPEQAELADVDPRSDIYSLGVVLFEMVTGHVPFEGPTPLSLAMKHKMEAPKNVREWNAQVPASLASIIARCLEKDPNKRFQSAAEMNQALEAAEREFGTGERAAAVPIVAAKKTKKEKKTAGEKVEKAAGTEKEEKSRGRKVLPFAVAGVLVACAAAAYFLFLRPTSLPLTPEEGALGAAAGDTGVTMAPPVTESPLVSSETKLGAADLKLNPAETGPPGTKTDSLKPSPSSAAEKLPEVKPKQAPLIETKPPAAETVKTAVPDPKAEAAKTKPAEAEVKKPEAKPNAVNEEAVKNPPVPVSVFSAADRKKMFAVQDGAMDARQAAFKGGHNADNSSCFAAASVAQDHASGAVTDNRIADAECWFAVAKKLFELCVSENRDAVRQRAFVRHVDQLREKVLAAWNQKPDDPLFPEAESLKTAARWIDTTEASLKAYADVAFRYEKILWMAAWTGKKY